MNGNSVHVLRRILHRRGFCPALCRTKVSDVASEKPKVSRVRKPKVTTPNSTDSAVPKDVAEYFQSKDPSILQLFPPSILRKTSQNAERFYISDRSTAQRIADIVTHDLPKDRLLVEVNPGPGMLTEQLLQRELKNLRLYETDVSFESRLKSQFNLPPDVLRIADFNGLWRLSYLDGFDSGRRVVNLLQGIPNKKWDDDDLSFRLFSVIGSVKFLRYLMNSITNQNEFYSLGRYEMILVMSPLLFSHIASTKNAGYKLYRGSTIVFQLYFEHEFLGTVPRKHFLPWNHNTNSSKKLRTLHQKLIQDGAEEWYLVKIMPRRNLYEHLLPDNLALFASFMTQHYVSRRSRVIPTLEHWIPHCGARLILNGNYTQKKVPVNPLPGQLLKSQPLSSNDYVDKMTIYTEFGELTPSQVLTLFNEFINWSDFHQSPFLQAVDSPKPKPNSARSVPTDEEDVLDDPIEPTSAEQRVSDGRVKKVKSLQ